MSSDPPPIPMGVSMPQRCVHGSSDEKACPFCATDRELEEHPELADTKKQPHEFGCPLFVYENYTEREQANYERLYGGDGRCNCKKEKIK